MNRQQFLKLLGVSLFDTVKEASAPLVEEKMLQVHQVIDTIQDIVYVKFPIRNADLQIEMIEGYCILRVGDEYYSNYCPMCKSMLHLIKNKEMKCFSCDEHFFEIENKYEKLQTVHKREVDGVILIGIPKK